MIDFICDERNKTIKFRFEIAFPTEKLVDFSLERDQANSCRTISNKAAFFKGVEDLDMARAFSTFDGKLYVPSGNSITSQ